VATNVEMIHSRTAEESSSKSKHHVKWRR